MALTRTLKENEKQFELVGNSSYRVKFQSKGKEIQFELTGNSGYPSSSYRCSISVYTCTFTHPLWAMRHIRPQIVHHSLSCHEHLMGRYPIFCGRFWGKFFKQQLDITVLYMWKNLENGPQEIGCLFISVTQTRKSLFFSEKRTVWLLISSTSRAPNLNAKKI